MYRYDEFDQDFVDARVAQFRATHDLWAGDPAFIALLDRLLGVAQSVQAHDSVPAAEAECAALRPAGQGS